MMTIFELLADPIRRQMLDLLRERARTVNEIAHLLAISQPGASRHLRMLREAGLVTVRGDAQRRWYELRPEPLAAVDAWLAPYRRLLEARFTRLDAVLDELKSSEGDEDGQVEDNG